jgi:chemotaxis signal transduction protein
MGAACVREVAKAWKILPCSRGAWPLSGLAKIKGHTVPVFDLASLLGCKRRCQTSKSRLIVAEGEYGALAFVVDSVAKCEGQARPALGMALVNMGANDERSIDIGETLSRAHLI